MNIESTIEFQRGQVGIWRRHDRIAARAGQPRRRICEPSRCQRHRSKLLPPPLPALSPQRRYQQRIAAENVARGLTTRGTMRKYHLWDCVLPRGERQRIERRDLVLQGLTTRGTQRIRRICGGAGVDKNARQRLHVAALNAIGLSARRRPKRQSANVTQEDVPQ